MNKLDQRFDVVEGELCGRSGQLGSRGGKMCGQINSLNETRTFSVFQNVNFLSKTEKRSIKNCEIVKLIIFVRGGHCDYSLRVQKKT
jgi:hypothetical protein